MDALQKNLASIGEISLACWIRQADHAHFGFVVCLAF
jgi:hypothetical protein